MMKRVLLSAMVITLFSGLVAFFSPITSPVFGIDSKAETGFEASVNEVGGSEASSLPALIKNSINIILYIAGVIAVIIIVIGGLRFVTSEGDAQAANKAKSSVVYALVGLVLAVLSYALVNFILDKIT